MAKTNQDMVSSLEEVIEAVNQEVIEEEYEVLDLETAAEAQRRISYFRDRQKEIDSIVEKQLEPFLKKIELIKAWGEEAKQEFIDSENYYTHRLEFFLREEVNQQLAKGKKPKKTIKLPYGSIKLAKQQPEYQKDEEQLTAYAKENGFVKTKESTDWAEIKKRCSVLGDKLIDENGEVVPGVLVVERDDKFSLVLED